MASSSSSSSCGGEYGRKLKSLSSRPAGNPSRHTVTAGPLGLPSARCGALCSVRCPIGRAEHVAGLPCHAECKRACAAVPVSVCACSALRGRLAALFAVVAALVVAAVARAHTDHEAVRPLRLDGQPGERGWHGGVCHHLLLEVEHGHADVVCVRVSDRRPSDLNFRVSVAHDVMNMITPPPVVVYAGGLQAGWL